MSVILIRVCRGKQIKGSLFQASLYLWRLDYEVSRTSLSWKSGYSSLFHTLHHLLQQWTEAEEEDGCNSCHDSKECEEVCEVGDLIAKE